MRPPRAVSCRSGVASRNSGPSRILAKIRSNGACRRKLGTATPSALTTSSIVANAVEPRVVTRDMNRAYVDIGCQDLPMQRARGGDSKHTAAGPEVKDT